MSVPATVLEKVFIRRSAAFAGYTFLVYDHLLTLPLEVTHIWSGSWTVIKALFLMVRYWTLIGQTIVVLEETGYLNHHSERFCVAFTVYRPFYVIICGEAIRLMVVMRTCAILGCKRIVAVTWNTLFILFTLSVLGVVVYFFIRFGPPNFEYLNETGICLSPTPPHLWTLLFIPITLDSFIVVIVYYSLRQFSGASRGLRPSPLVRLLIRDALLFYVSTLFNSIFCIICWTVWSLDPRNRIQEWISTPLLIVMGERLILNLRQLRARPDSTRELSEEVRRQIAAMGIDAEQSDAVPLSDVVLELNPLGQ